MDIEAMCERRNHLLELKYGKGLTVYQELVLRDLTKEMERLTPSYSKEEWELLGKAQDLIDELKALEVSEGGG